MCKQPLPIYLATVFITTPIMVTVLPDYRWQLIFLYLFSNVTIPFCPMDRSLPQSGVFERQVGIPAFQSTGRSWWQTESQPLAREKDLARDIAFEHHLHFSEILPLFPRSLLTLRNHSCWRCLVPPPCITLQRGCHDDKVLRPRCRPIPFPRVSFGAHLQGMCYHQHYFSYHQHTALFLFWETRNKQAKPSSSATTALTAMLVSSFFSGR